MNRHARRREEALAKAQRKSPLVQAATKALRRAYAAHQAAPTDETRRELQEAGEGLQVASRVKRVRPSPSGPLPLVKGIGRRP